MISDVLVALPSSFLIHFSPAVQRTDNRYIPTDACAPLAADTTLGPLCQWRRDRGDNSFSLHGDGALPFSTSPPSPTVKQLRPNPPPAVAKRSRLLTRTTTATSRNPRIQNAKVFDPFDTSLQALYCTLYRSGGFQLSRWPRGALFITYTPNFFLDLLSEYNCSICSVHTELTNQQHHHMPR
jgi:hypothetical protein